MRNFSEAPCRSRVFDCAWCNAHTPQRRHSSAALSLQPYVGQRETQRIPFGNELVGALLRLQGLRDLPNHRDVKLARKPDKIDVSRAATIKQLGLVNSGMHWPLGCRGVDIEHLGTIRFTAGRARSHVKPWCEDGEGGWDSMATDATLGALRCVDRIGKTSECASGRVP